MNQLRYDPWIFISKLVADNGKVLAALLTVLAAFGLIKPEQIDQIIKIALMILPAVISMVSARTAVNDQKTFNQALNQKDAA